MSRLKEIIKITDRDISTQMTVKLVQYGLVVLRVREPGWPGACCRTRTLGDLFATSPSELRDACRRFGAADPKIQCYGRPDQHVRLTGKALAKAIAEADANARRFEKENEGKFVPK